MVDSKSSWDSSDSNLLNKIIRIFFLKMSFGGVRSLVGISFHSDGIPCLNLMIVRYCH